LQNREPGRRPAAANNVRACCLGLLLAAAAAQVQPPAPGQDLAHPQNTNAGIYAFTDRCARCHDAGTDRAQVPAPIPAPDRYSLNRRTPEEVLAAITTGSMAGYAQGLTDFEKRVVAVYVGGRPLGAAATGEPWQHYDLGHGWCTYSFFEQCPHRMACARCDFYTPKGSTKAQLLDHRP